MLLLSAPPPTLVVRSAALAAPRLRHAARAAFVLALLPAAACQPVGPRPQIQADDAGARILAIREAGERRDRQAVPLLVDRLEDEDEAVRFYAILALERITGTRLGYDYRIGGPARFDAVERWRRYVRDSGVASTDAPDRPDADAPRRASHR